MGGNNKSKQPDRKWVLTSSSSVFVTEDTLSGARARVDDVADHGASLAPVSPRTPAAPDRRRLTAAFHVRTARLLRADLRLHRLNHRLIARALAPL